MELHKRVFQFKHCTIIRENCRERVPTGFSISIQALYDYKLLICVRES